MGQRKGNGRDNMAARQPRYSKEEFAHRGHALYEKCVRPRVERGNRGRIVAIDIETGEFEVGDDAVTASGRLLARCPDAQPFLRPVRGADCRPGFCLVTLSSVREK